MHLNMLYMEVKVMARVRILFDLSFSNCSHTHTSIKISVRIT